MKLFVYFAFVMVLVGCKINKVEYSAELTEEAAVVDSIYVPAVHGSGMGPTISMNENFGLAFLGVTIEPKYAVIFQCQHGKFIIESRKAKELWQRLKKDQRVVVTFREVYMATYKKNNLLERRLIKYDFVDAR